MNYLQHIQLLSLSAILLYITYTTLFISKLLFIHINITLQPTFPNPHDHIIKATFHKADTLFKKMFYSLLPMSLISLTLIITIWIAAFNNYSIPLSFQLITTLSITYSITTFIQYHKIPDWVQPWLHTINNIILKAYLETIQNELISLKNELIEATQQNKPQHEINIIKLQCLYLSRESFILNNNMIQAQYITDLINELSH